MTFAITLQIVANPRSPYTYVSNACPPSCAAHALETYCTPRCRLQEDQLHLYPGDCLLMCVGVWLTTAVIFKRSVCQTVARIRIASQGNDDKPSNMEQNVSLMQCCISGTLVRLILRLLCLALIDVILDFRFAFPCLKFIPRVPVTMFGIRL